MCIRDSLVREDLSLDGVADLTISNGNTSFIYMGPVVELLSKINSFQVRDVFIEEPTLEEIFLHYYQ